MKLLSLAATVLHFARADEDSQEAESALEEAGVDPKKFSGIVRMINSEITTSLDYETIVKRIQNYGCHCFPGMSRSAGGQGAPVDELDSACHTLYRCHRCVDMDYSNACDVDKGKYRFKIQNGVIDCNSARNSACQQDQCRCDKEFAETVGRFWDDSQFNRHFWLARKNVKAQDKAGTPVFDAANVCQNSQTNVAPDQCCGTAPWRRPYSSTVMECCADESLKTFGTC